MAMLWTANASVEQCPNGHLSRTPGSLRAKRAESQKLNDYLAKIKDHELKKEQVSYMLDKILSYTSIVDLQFYFPK